MIKKRILFIIIFFLIISSCINMNEPKQQAEYINCLNSFDTSLVRFMPKKIPNNMISMGYASLDFLGDPNDYAGIYLTTKIHSIESYIEMRDKFINQALFVKNSLDSCLIIIPTYGELQESYIDTQNCTSVLPVPQYGICMANDSTHIWERKTQEKIIILDYGFKDVLNRKNTNRGKDLPIDYAKGYSTGISVNDTDLTIQYWLIVW